MSEIIFIIPKQYTNLRFSLFLKFTLPYPSKDVTCLSDLYAIGTQGEAGRAMSTEPIRKEGHSRSAYD